MPTRAADESGKDHAPDDAPADESMVRATNPVGRSRFSQWLASFGLGEMPMPLLTRRRAHRG
jgi:hypothetical protein